MFRFILILLIQFINCNFVEAMEKSEDSDGKTGWIVVGIIIAALLYFYNNRNEEEDPDVVAVRNIVTASRTQNLNRASVPKSSSVSEEIKGENPRKLSGQSSNNRATMSTSEMELILHSGEIFKNAVMPEEVATVGDESAQESAVDDSTSSRKFPQAGSLGNHLQLLSTGVYSPEKLPNNVFTELCEKIAEMHIPDSSSSESVLDKENIHEKDGEEPAVEEQKVENVNKPEENEPKTNTEEQIREIIDFAIKQMEIASGTKTDGDSSKNIENVEDSKKTDENHDVSKDASVIPTEEANDSVSQSADEMRELIDFITENLKPEPLPPNPLDSQQSDNEGEIEINCEVASELDLDDIFEESFEQLLQQNMTVTECFEILCQRESKKDDFGDDIKNLKLLFSENIRLKSFCKSVAYGDHVVSFEKKDYSVHIVAKNDFSGIKFVVFEKDGQFKTYHHIEETDQKTRYALSAISSAVSEACSNKLLLEIKNPGGYDGLTVRILGNNDVIYSYNGNDHKIDNGLVYFDNGNNLPNFTKKAAEIIPHDVIAGSFESIVEQLRNMKIVEMPKLHTTFVPVEEE